MEQRQQQELLQQQQQQPIAQTNVTETQLNDATPQQTDKS